MYCMFANRLADSGAEKSW